MAPPSPKAAAAENDPAALVLFQHWQTGHKLAGPHDFHSAQHYLRLYVMATKSHCEPLQNEGESMSHPSLPSIDKRILMIGQSSIS